MYIFGMMILDLQRPNWPFLSPNFTYFGSWRFVKILLHINLSKFIAKSNLMVQGATSTFLECFKRFRAPALKLAIFELGDTKYLIRTNFRADKFSCIFAQNLDLREIARKLVPNFLSFVAGARKLIPAKNFKLHILKKPIQKRSFSQQFARNCAKISTEFRIFVGGARK